MIDAQQAGAELERHVGHLDGHRLIVGQAQAADPGDRRRGGQAEPIRDVRVADLVGREHPR